MPFAQAAAWGDGEDEFDVAWVDLLMTGGCRPPRQARVRSTPDGTRRPCRTLRRQGLSPKRTPAAIRRSSSASAISDLARAERLLGGHAGALEPSFVAGPVLRQEQSQTHHHRDLDARQRPARHQGLTIRSLAQGRRVLRRDPRPSARPSSAAPYRR